MQDPAQKLPRESPVADSAGGPSELAETLPPSKSADARAHCNSEESSARPRSGDSFAQPPSGRSPSRLDSPDSRAASESWHLPGGRYQVVGEIARGGMGVVLRAIDADLQRPLAVKVMQGPASDAQQERFLEEARITGQLQHPGVPPVHEIGRTSDGLPFFSMKLIEGRTLSKLLRERHSPQDDLPHLLMVFEQIAQTVAYAHSRDIIHRDLKPSNVMVGAFGEVQVMDWGLAKRLAGVPLAEDVRREEANADSRKPAAEGSTAGLIGSYDQTIDKTPPTPSAAALTQAGEILGTPAYMPPEQALGDGDRIDQRADVFGLGAILCEILTGKPPYFGDDAMQVYRMAVQTSLHDCWARLDASDTDPELVELTRRCLTPQRDNRPRDAGVVSTAVTQYLESVQQRLKQTEIERAEAQTRAIEEQKRREVEQAKAHTEHQKRRLTIALAGALLILVMGGSGAVWWYQANQAWQAQQKAARDAEDLRRENELAIEQAARDAELKARQDNLNREVSTNLQEAEVQRDELHARLADPNRVHVLLSDIDQWERLIEMTRSVWERAEALAQSDPELLRPDVADRLRELDESISADEQDFKLAQALDTIRQNTNLAVGGNWDPIKVAAQYPQTFHEAGYEVEGGDPEAVAKRVRQSPIRYALVAALDHWALFADSLEGATRILAVAQQADDPDPWRSRLREELVQPDRATLQQLAASVEIEEQSPQMLVLFSVLLHYVDVDPAPMLRQALIFYPKDYNLHFRLGMAARDPQERIGSYRAALAVRPDSTSAHCNLSSILIDAGDADGAISHCRKALEIDPNFGWIHNNLGRALRMKGDEKEAIASFQKAIALDPDNARAHVNLGSALATAGDRQAAIRHFQTAIDIDPDDAMTRYNLGIALSASGDREGAVAKYQEAIRIDPQLAEAYCNLALVLDRLGRFDEALVAIRRGHELGSSRKAWNYPSDQWVAEIERNVALDRKLNAVLAGDAKPADAKERLEMARLLLVYKKNYAEAARFFAETFEADLSLAADLRSQNRYDAACAAALTIAGNDDASKKLTDDERQVWLTQARSWLAADLDAWMQLLDQDTRAAPFIHRALQHWRTDPDLSSVRDPAALAKLPADEQAAWQQLWADVQDAVERSEATSR